MPSAIEPSQIPHFDVLIVGAGWSGLWALYSIRRKGFSCLCIEANSSAGGVWLYTRYPGCRNETETPVYQFSAQETWETWKWKERFPAQADVHAYLRHVAKVLDLNKDIVFNARVSKAQWDICGKQWEIHVKDKPFVTAQFFVPCTGYAGQKYVPDIKGLDMFEHAYHSSEWPSDLSVKGKRVGVIGTGSSGMQIIETVGPSVGHLTVFQRNPNMALPRYQEKLTAETEAAEQKMYVQRYRKMHKTPTGLEIMPIDRDTFDDNPEQRKETYQDLWEKGAQNFWFGNYRDVLEDHCANRLAYEFWRWKTIARIQNPAVRDLLAPKNPPYAFGTKRPSLESSYFEVYNQPNVKLVNLKSDSISEITRYGIQMESGDFFEIDILVLATGYDFGIGSQLAIDIRGEDDVSLKSKWQSTPGSPNGVSTYLGIMCSGFPNMLLSCGPHAPTAFGITPRLAEVQGNWIANCLEYVHKRGSTIETTRQAERWWKVEVENAVNRTLIPGTDGWYMSNNIPGRKKEPLFWFGGVPEYMEHCDDCAKGGYRGFVIM